MGFAGSSCHHCYWEIKRQLNRLYVRDEISQLTFHLCSSSPTSSIKNRILFASVYHNFLYLYSCVKSICVVHPGELSHCRPVTLTSHLIKTMERIVLRHLHILDLLQFAYRVGVGVDDATFTFSPQWASWRPCFVLFFTPPVLSAPSSNHCCGRRWRRLVWTNTLWLGAWTTSLTDHST